MRSLTLRRAAVAAVVPLALGSLAACGNGNGDSTQAADPGAGGPSTTTTPSHSAKANPGPKRIAPAAFVNRLKSATRSLTTARFHLSMDVAGQTIYAKGALDMTGDHPAM